MEQPCHPSAKCVNIPGSYKCNCPTGTVGDPFLEPGCLAPDQCVRDNDCADTLVCIQGRCTDPCLLPDHNCGRQAVCNVFDHSAVCACPAGHLGDPNDSQIGCFKVECLTSDDCALDKDCDSQSNKCISK